MANLGQNVTFRQKQGVQEFGQRDKSDDKKGHLDKWQFYKNDKFGKKIIKVWQKCKQDDKTGMLIIVGFTK